MVASDNQPLSIVENKGFMKFCKTAVPLYKLPSRRTFTKMMDNKYDVLSEVVKRTLGAIDRCAMTADVWTDTCNVKSYLGMTVHFLEGTSMRSVALAVLPLDESHTAAYLAERIKDVCHEWNIQTHKVITIFYLFLLKTF